MTMRTAAYAACLFGLLIPGVGASQAIVVGTVRDSVAGTVVSGAAVQLVLRDDVRAGVRSAIADAAGVFRMDRVPPGRYLLGFTSHQVDWLGMEPPVRAVDVLSGDAEVHADLALPSAPTIAAAVCAVGGRGGPHPYGNGVLLGQVLDAGNGAAIAAGVVTVQWGEVRADARGMHRDIVGVRAAVGVGDDGRYAACGVPTGVPLRVQATAESRGAPTAASGEVELTVDPTTVLLHRDLMVGTTLTRTSTSETRNERGTARLGGRVSLPDGRPVMGARVVVHGTGAPDSVAVTGADGAYRLAALPGGTYAIEVLFIGHTPIRAAVDLRPMRAASLDLALGARVTELEEILVTGAAAPTSAFAKRMRRYAHGGGYFLTGEQIERRAGRNMTGVLLTMPTLRLGGTSIDGTGTERQIIKSRFGCLPTFYLDGVKVPEGAAGIDILVAPSAVGGVEVYADQAQMPSGYGVGHCGIVLVWTKGSIALR